MTEAAWVGIVQAVASGATISWDEGIQLYCCSACGRQWDAEDEDAATTSMIHKPWCIVNQARALLEEKQS